MRAVFLFLFCVLASCSKSHVFDQDEIRFSIKNETGFTLEKVEMYGIKMKNLRPGERSKTYPTPDEVVLRDNPSFSFEANSVRFLAVLLPDSTAVKEEISIDSLYFGAYPSPYWSRSTD